MMTIGVDDRDYYDLRARQERERAAATSHPNIRRAHLELAGLYDARLQGLNAPRLRVVN